MEKRTNSPKGCGLYSLMAILFTLGAFLSGATNVPSLSVVMAIAIGLGLFFSYKAIQCKKSSGTFIEVICFSLNLFLAIVLIVDYLQNRF